MKRTFTANINGLIFNVDEDAYARLQEYLKSLRNHFLKNEGVDEIISDIESRISELMQRLISPQKQVITLFDVEGIIKQLGEPEEIEDENEEKTSEENPKSQSPEYENVGKRFFRNPDDKVISGVCSGLAAYFGIDPIILRILFVIFFFVGGSSFWVYIILWVAIPEARTSIDKLQMKGEPVNVNNIEKKIKEELNDLGSRIKDYGNEAGEAFTKASRNIAPKTGLERFFNSFFEMMSHVFRAFGILFGIVFIMVGIFMLVGFSFSFFALDNTFVVTSMGLNSISIPQFADAFISNTSEKSLLMTGLILAIGIPLVMLIYNGMKLIFGWKFEIRFLGLSAFSLWLAGAVFLGIVAFGIGNDFTNKGSASSTLTLENTKGNTLYVKAKELNELNIDNVEFYTGKWNIVSTKDEKVLFGIPEISIITNNENEFRTNITKFSKGKNTVLASKRAKNIQFEIEQIGDTLFIDPYYTLLKEEVWRNQNVKLQIFIPSNKNIFFDKSMSEILNVDQRNSNLQEFIGKSVGLDHKKQENRELINMEPDKN